MVNPSADQIRPIAWVFNTFILFFNFFTAPTRVLNETKRVLRVHVKPIPLDEPNEYRIGPV